MKKSTVIAVLILSLLLTGCGQSAQPEQKQYTATFLELFDTVTTVVGKADSEEAFTRQANQVRDGLMVYHKLFDAYEEYEGIANVKTINDRAWQEPVTVDSILMDLLKDCKAYGELTQGRVNVAMGSVLRLWHDCRSDGIDDPANARLPEQSLLEDASEHCSLEDLVLDEENHTVFLADLELRLDVGAIAKGWAVQHLAQTLPEGLLISVGGNICATGPKSADGTPWVIGIQDPEGGPYLHTITLTRGSVVTSGDYQRAYTVDGKVYHHIIDPDTLYPAAYWRSVSVVCEDSGLADALSTALFTLPLEEGMALAAQCGAEAMWLDADYNKYYSPGFSGLIRN